MIRVQLDRDGCISCTNCWAICPSVFQRNAIDCHTEVACPYRGQDISSGEVPEDLEACVTMAAEFCPVSVIKFG